MISSPLTETFGSVPPDPANDPARPPPPHTSCTIDAAGRFGAPSGGHPGPGPDAAPRDPAPRERPMRAPAPCAPPRFSRMLVDAHDAAGVVPPADVEDSVMRALDRLLDTWRRDADRGRPRHERAHIASI